MINAYELPTVIESCGQSIPIRNKADWRTIIDVNIALTDVELTDQERVIASLTIFYDMDIASIKDPSDAAKKMVEFIAVGDDETVGPKKPKLIDWQDDAALIVSGVNSVLNTEIRAQAYMHWWTFVAAYSAIGDSVLATVVGIRDKIARNKKLEKHEREFKDNNPQYFSRKRDAEAEYNVLLDLID